MKKRKYLLITLMMLLPFITLVSLFSCKSEFKSSNTIRVSFITNFTVKDIRTGKHGHVDGTVVINNQVYSVSNTNHYRHYSFKEGDVISAYVTFETYKEDYGNQKIIYYYVSDINLENYEI